MGGPPGSVVKVPPLCSRCAPVCTRGSTTAAQRGLCDNGPGVPGAHGSTTGAQRGTWRLRARGARSTREHSGSITGDLATTDPGGPGHTGAHGNTTGYLATTGPGGPEHTGAQWEHNGGLGDYGPGGPGAHGLVLFAVGGHFAPVHGFSPNSECNGSPADSVRWDPVTPADSAMGIRGINTS